MCKINRHILQPVQNLPFTIWYTHIERALHKSPYKKSSLHMAVIGSSTIQTLRLRLKHREGMGCKCLSMAFLEECSEYLPEFFHSLTRSRK